MYIYFLPSTFNVRYQKAQNLKGPITSSEKILGSLESEMQALIIAVDASDPNHVMGFVKFGRRSLYFYDKKGVVSNLPSQLCCLDFMVEEVRSLTFEIHM